MTKPLPASAVPFFTLLASALWSLINYGLHLKSYRYVIERAFKELNNDFYDLIPAIILPEIS